jgi:transcriptional regulator with XRE-family HTH domain
MPDGHLCVGQEKHVMEMSGDETFGILLKTFRERRGLKQEALAYKIGKKNRGSIDAWERGLYRPKHREMVLTLSQALQLSERETNQLLAAADFPPAYQLPESSSGQDLESLKQRYFAWILDQYEYMDTGGISPRVASRAGARTIKIRMEDIFVPLQAWEENVVDDAGMDIVLSSSDSDRLEFFQVKYSGSSKEEQEANIATLAKRFPSANIHVVSAYGEDTLEEIGKKYQAMAALSKMLPSVSHTPITLDRLLEHRRVVLLGHPGAGKTTLGKYIAYALTSHKTALLGNLSKGTIPLLVRVADYGRAFKRGEELSFYRYVTGTYHSDHFGPLLEWALEHNQCLVIIDGLDEVPDPLWRKRVTQKIEQFVSEYRANRFVVTSRLVGYRENQLTGNFTHVQLIEWGEPHIVGYLEKWYQAIREKGSTSIDTSSKQQAQKLWEAIKARKGVQQLAGVPLLLMIIALVDQYGGKLPERRVEVYQLATETLLSSWPFHHREQQIDLQEVLQILAPIAYHIFTRSEDRLITEYEFRPLFEEQVRQLWGTDERKTRIRSVRLLRSIEEHTGFLLRRGTNGHGQELYVFLHPTFVEYLTARYLAERWEKERVLEIADRVHEPTWHEVVLLMAGHLGKLMPVLATRLVEYIEQLPSAFDDLLHRNLLLVAEIIGDNVPLERWKRDEIIIRLLSLALETTFEPLWTSIVDRLRRLARVSPPAQLPDQLKQYEKDLSAAGVRKVLLARCLGFSRETDLCLLVQGLFTDEMTCKLAKTVLRAEFQRGKRKQRTSAYTCFIRFTTKGEMSLVGPIDLSQQVAARLRNLPLPIRDDIILLGTASSLTSAGEVWVFDREQPLRLGASRLAALLTACQKLDYFLVMILTDLIEHSSGSQTLLYTWIKQATEQTASDERVLALGTLKEIFRYSKPSKFEAIPPFLRTAVQAMVGTDEDPHFRAMIFSVACRLSEDPEELRNILLRGLSDPTGEVRTTAIREAEWFLSCQPLSSQPVATSWLLNKLWALTTDPLPEICLVSMRALSYHARSIVVENVFHLIDLLCNQSLASLTQYSTRRYIIDLLRLAELLDTPTALSSIGDKFVTLIEQMAMETGEATSECEALPRDLDTIRLPLSVRAQEVLAKQLSPLLQHGNARVRWLAAAIWAVVFNRLPQAPDILPLIQDTDAAVRSAAFEALPEADLVKPGVLAMIQHALRQDEAHVKRALLRRIKKSTQVRPSSPQVVLSQPEMIDGLLDALGDEESSIASQAATLLALVQEPVVRRRIITAVSTQAAENLFALQVLWDLVMPTETS